MVGIRSENIYEIPIKEYAAFNDTSFVSGDSPATHDINTVLVRNGFGGFIDNYGVGDLQYSISVDGTNFGNNVYLPAGARDSLDGFEMDSIRITHVADTKYSIRIK